MTKSSRLLFLMACPVDFNLPASSQIVQAITLQ